VLRALARDIATGFNTNDPELSTAHVAQNATAVSVTGARLDGREALIDAKRAGLPGSLRDATALRADGHRFLEPDSAIAHKRAWSTSYTAAEGRTPGMIALYGFARHGGRWWIVARQNTAIRA
jgi:uncharacterized protein (TIGR02246 family)